ncbi:MAG TPA: integrase [Rhodospirillaceae bacterium]|jgi:integrase|nr:integrase arm-type DNA-binding domain-containing protein [Alphaproteobacteria bacterium]HBH26620.1 integrase [Rhodospirillaceae bacterium]
MALTNTQCQNAKPRAKPYKMADGGGLVLLVNPNGARYWRLRYYWLDKEKMLGLGVYPRMSLAQAREKREEAKKLLAQGMDPSAAKKQAKRDARANAENTFEAVAREWHGKKTQIWAPRTGEKILTYLENDVFPHIGARPIAEIDPPELLDMLRKIEARKAYYAANRMKQVCGQIFRYGVATGKCPRDPAADLKGALTTAKTCHLAALNIKDIPEFLQNLDRNAARLYPQTRRGIRLLMLTAVRTTELIRATWDEIDLENAVWEIPAERMKMGAPHIVPLSRQVVVLFQEQREDTEHLTTSWVFPSQPRPRNHMSNNTILQGIKRLGYGGRMTGHGFRSLFMTTLMEELGYPHEIPDAQLAHAKGNSVRRAYDRTKYLEQRKGMMQRWADYVDAIAHGNTVIVGKFGKTA